MTETGICCSGICAGRAVCRLFCLRYRSVPLHCRIRLGCSGRTGCLSGSRCLLWYVSGCGVLYIRAHCSVLRCLSGLSPGGRCSGLCGRRTCNTPGCLGSCRRFNGCRCSGLSHRSLTGHLMLHSGLYGSVHHCSAAHFPAEVWRQAAVYSGQPVLQLLPAPVHSVWQRLYASGAGSAHWHGLSVL